MLRVLGTRYQPSHESVYGSGSTQGNAAVAFKLLLQACRGARAYGRLSVGPQLQVIKMLSAEER